MVMRNRHDGANAPQWWDDLPPEIKKRCANSPHLRNQELSDNDCDEQEDWWENPPPSRVRVTRDLSWLALIFVALVVAILTFLLIATSFLRDRGAFGG